MFCQFDLPLIWVTHSFLMSSVICMQKLSCLLVIRNLNSHLWFFMLMVKFNLILASCATIWSLESVCIGWKILCVTISLIETHIVNVSCVWLMYIYSGILFFSAEIDFSWIHKRGSTQMLLKTTKHALVWLWSV